MVPSQTLNRCCNEASLGLWSGWHSESSRKQQVTSKELVFDEPGGLDWYNEAMHRMKMKPETAVSDRPNASRYRVARLLGSAPRFQ